MSPISLRALMQGPRPVTAPLVLNPLADGFGITREGAPDWGPTEEAMLSAIDLEKLLAVERATVEKGKT